MMERHDIERLTKMEQKLETIEKQLLAVLSKLDTYNQRQLDCEQKFVRYDDSSYFYKNISKYNQTKLTRSNGWIALLNGIYKVIIIGAGIVIIINNVIVK